MLNWEKELLGLYVTSHPIDPVIDQLRHIQPNYTHELKEAGPEQQDSPVKLVVLIGGLRKIPTKNRDMMCIAQIEDRFGSMDAVLFPRTWTQYEELMQEGAVVFLSGKLDVSRGDAQIICEHVTTSFEALTAESGVFVPDEHAALAWEVDAPSIEPVVQAEPATPDYVSPAPHIPTRAHGNGNGSGNGHTPPEPPRWEDLPPVGMDSDDLRDLAPFDEDEKPAPPPCDLMVTFTRTGDAERDNQRFRRIFGILKSYPGQDHFTILIHADDGDYLLDFPNDTTCYCDKLLKELTSFLGAGQVTLR